jgi:hypothetical protein
VTESQNGLSIGELARRTEVPAATLRSWEDRYGFPRPHRLAGGHHRYDDGAARLGSGPKTDELSVTSGPDGTHATATFALD